MKDNNDPRLSLFFTKAKAGTGEDLGYKGAPSGYALGTSFNYQPSNLNQNLAKAPLKILIMTYSEVQFILAELVNKGIIIGKPANLLRNRGEIYNRTMGSNSSCQLLQ